MIKGEKRICGGCKKPGDGCIEFDTADNRVVRGVDGSDGELWSCPLPFISDAGEDISRFKPVTNVETVSS